MENYIDNYILYSLYTTVMASSPKAYTHIDDEMYVTKRDGRKEIVSFDKILQRIKKVGLEANIKVNYTSLVMKVIDQIYDSITTTLIDELSAQQCASLSTVHPDYNILAGRLTVSNHQKNTSSSFIEVMENLYNSKDKHGLQSKIVSDELIQIVKEHGSEIENMIDYNRDYLIDYFGIKTLERAYLLRINKVIVERPQHMWMRVSIGIHGNKLDKIKETYDYMSNKYFTHATPTLFNAGTPHPQLSSCYLLAMESDSIEGIYNTLKDCALISKWAGGIGLHIHNVRASGSDIRGTNGSSNGIVPMLRVFNHTAKYVDQCVVPETIIYTTKGPIEIQHCVVGETEIVNAQGEVETIQDVLEHPYEGELLHIQTLHSMVPLQITPEHPVWAIQGQKKGLNYSVIENRLKKNHALMEWVDAKELDEDSMVGFPIPSYKKDVETIFEKDCYVYGLLLGDGYMSNKTDASGHITLHKTNKKHVESFMIDYFNENCVQYNVQTEENTTRIRWNQCLHLPFRHQDLYNEQKEKRISFRWLHLPLYKIKQIVKGLLHSDGCIHKEIMFDTTSRTLVEGLRYLLLRMGILTSGYVRDRIGQSHRTVHGDIIEHKRLNYCLRIPKTQDICELLELEYDSSQFFKFFTYENMLFTRIQSIESSQYKGVLYDLQMRDEHNYLIHNGLIHNGGGKRNGSFAIYLEPWHFDIEMFLQMRKNHGEEDLKARDLFYALWTPDLFMERIKADGDWTLMCPDECPGLSDVYGDDFKELYEKYEREGKGRTVIKARSLWFQVLDAQMETGTPYLLFKDHVNRKCNQKNLGTIKSSNLCCEITEYSDDKETAVCNLASIALPAFLKKRDEDEVVVFDYESLHNVTQVVTNNLNNIIDVNFYPTEKTHRSNMRHRPIGIGVQGLADVFFKMDIPFHSEEAKELNKMIFETIYHGALTMSCKLAVEQGKYETFDGSPASKGELQFDLWGIDPGQDRYDWNAMKQEIMEKGLRNSLLVAPMPTASTSQILGYNECIEPITSNIYSRRTLAGEFVLANKYLMKELIDLGIWNEEMKNNMVANHGSIQHMEIIPEHIRNKYKTVWEMPMKHLIDMAADRGAFICQSQSLNLWLEEPNYSNLTSMHFYSWTKGLKTGIYYLRRRARHQAQQYTIEPEKAKHGENTELENEDEICEMCSA